jgi:hypothetical protein
MSLGNDHYYGWNPYGFVKVFRMTNLADPDHGIGAKPGARIIRFPCTKHNIVYAAMNPCVTVSDASLINSKLLGPKLIKDHVVLLLPKATIPDDDVGGSSDDDDEGYALDSRGRQYSFFVRVPKLSEYLASLFNREYKQARRLYREHMEGEDKIDVKMDTRCWSLRSKPALSVDPKTLEYKIVLQSLGSASGSGVGKKRPR